MTTGWHYTQKPEYRRQLVYESTNKQQSRFKRYLEAANKMIAVFKVSLDNNVKQTAKSDADYFYRMVRNMQRIKTGQSKKEIDRNFDKWSEEYMEAWGGK